MAAEEKRERRIIRLFSHESEQEPAPRVKLDVTGIIFKYSSGKETRWDLAKAFGGKLPPPSVGRAAAAFGINTSAGNAGNTLKGEDGQPVTDPDDIQAEVEARLADFESGIWSAERAAPGPRTSLMLEAAIAYRQASGKPVDDAWTATIRQRLADDPEFRKDLLSRKDFKVVMEELKLKKAQASAAAAKAEAGAGPKASDLL